MTSPSRELPLVTPLQFAFLTVLTESAFSGNRMRAELARCGVFKSKDAFFRVMQRLKEANLVTASRIPRPEGEPPGAQSVYELTRDGVGATALMRGLYGKAGRRLRLRRWRRVRTLKLSHRFNRTAKRSGASRSERQ